MKTTVERRTKVKFPVENLLLFAFEGANRPAGRWEKIDIKLQKKYRAAAENERFGGKAGQLLVLYPEDGRPAKRVLVAGLGNRARVNAESLRRAVALAVPRLKKVKADECVVLLPVEEKVDTPVAEQAQAAVEALILTSYTFSSYWSKSDDEKAVWQLKSLRMIYETDRNAAQMKDGVRLGEIDARGVCATRDLINEPAMFATPRHLADTAQKIARGKARISVKVYDEKQMKKMGMNCVLGVAAGSNQPPRFVHLSYRAQGAKKSIAIVGKGITFDSGGLCIKPSSAMLDMKDDMAGAAVVLGVFSVLDEVRPKINVHGVFPATENMTGGSAYKTRDILRALNKKTIEIINTDAEGRLVLADALSYASKLKPQEMIDLATLTGACVVALGTKISGIFGTDQALVDRVIESGRQAGERLWQLPLEEEYRELIRSESADMKNSGGQWGGAITAALLLEEFVDKSISWAHIDIASEAFNNKAEHYNPPGAAGVMVRTILRYLRAQG